jgi:hypothetical protein
MAISKLFKKESAPDELPDLAIDELKKTLKKDFSEKEEVKNEEKKEETQKPEEVKNEEKAPEQTEKEENNEKIPPESIEEKKENKSEEKVNLDKSFFNPLIKELKKDNFDPSKIDGWYKQQFSEKSAIEGMKEYWEKQKNEFITESIEKEFKTKISERMVYLQKLESEWQEIYINIIKKEEEMKKEEKNIKDIIKEFSEVLKKNGNVKKENKIK